MESEINWAKLFQTLRDVAEADDSRPGVSRDQYSLSSEQKALLARDLAAAEKQARLDEKRREMEDMAERGTLAENLDADARLAEEITRLETTSPADDTRLRQLLHERLAGLATILSRKFVPEDQATQCHESMKRLAQTLLLRRLIDSEAGRHLEDSIEVANGGYYWNLMSIQEQRFSQDEYFEKTRASDKAAENLIRYAEKALDSFRKVKAPETITTTLDGRYEVYEESVVVNRIKDTPWVNVRVTATDYFIYRILANLVRFNAFLKMTRKADMWRNELNAMNLGFRLKDIARRGQTGLLTYFWELLRRPGNEQ